MRRLARLEYERKSGASWYIILRQSPKLRRQLARLDAANGPQDMNVPGWKLHALAEDLSGHWSVWASGNWPLTFTFDGEDAVLVDYQDYH